MLATTSLLRESWPNSDLKSFEWFGSSLTEPFDSGLWVLVRRLNGAAVHRISLYVRDFVPRFRVLRYSGREPIQDEDLF